MPVKVVDANASAPSAAIADGIRYAVAHGADIVLLALFGTDPGAYLQDAVRAASDAGTLVACAAGNGGRDTTPEYPASFAFANLIRVAATGRDGTLSRMSNVDPHTVDIAAAGDGILSTASGGGYERRSGTSLAAATVAGAAALTWAAAPSLDATTLRRVLVATARHRHRLPIAGGTLDLARAMRRARALT